MLQAWDPANTAVEVPHAESDEPVLPEHGHLHGHEVEQVLIPLHECVTLVALAGNVAMKKGNLLLPMVN